MKKLILALAVTGFAFTSAHAQEMDMSKVDSDQDGAVTLEEANAAGLTWTAEQFATVDVDGDGKLNADEYAAATAK